MTRNSLRNMPDYWLEQCISFDAMFAAHMMPYTVQPNVLSGRVELSGVFLLREALLADKVKFGECFVFCDICQREYVAGVDFMCGSGSLLHMVTICWVIIVYTCLTRNCSFVTASVVVPESVALESHCSGCESAVLVQHLLRVKQWSSTRLPIDGMKSVVFEGPSPTLCVAAGACVFIVMCVGMSL